MADAGTVAIGTTSSGVAWASGLPDGEHLSRTQAIGALEGIVRAVDIPVSADLEGGYGTTQADVATTTAAAIDVGAVGINLEDRPGTNGAPLRTVADQCRRLEAARNAADGRADHVVLNVRTDVFLAGVGQEAGRLDEVLTRAQAFKAAGADCLFVPGLTDPAHIRQLAAESPLPVNLMLSPGAGPTIRALQTMGVRRISLGSYLIRVAYAAVAAATSDILEGLSHGYQVVPDSHVRPHSDIQALLTAVHGE